MYIQHRGGFMIHVGDILSTVGDKSFVIWISPRYWTPPRYTWCPPTWLKLQNSNYSNYDDDIPPQYWTLLTVLTISPTCIMIPPQYWVCTTVLKISPTLLMIPPLYWTPHSRYPPHLSWYSHSTEHPQRYSRYPPTVLMISPPPPPPRRYRTHIIQSANVNNILIWRHLGLKFNEALYW